MLRCIELIFFVSKKWQVINVNSFVEFIYLWIACACVWLICVNIYLKWAVVQWPFHIVLHRSHYSHTHTRSKSVWHLAHLFALHASMQLTSVVAMINRIDCCRKWMTWILRCRQFHWNGWIAAYRFKQWIRVDQKQCFEREISNKSKPEISHSAKKLHD